MSSASTNTQVIAALLNQVSELKRRKAALEASKPVIAVDIDEVLGGFLPAIIRWHNDNYDTSLTLDNFHRYV
jgi:hypothetical protein